MDFTLDEWLGIWGLILAVAGFGATFWAAWKAKGAAEAAKKAATGATQQILRGLLVSLERDLARVESGFDTAMEQDDRKRVRERVVEWREKAAEARGLIEEHTTDEAALLLMLRRSLTLATATKDALAGSTNLHDDTSKLRRSMSTVNAEIRTFTSGLIIAAGEVNGRGH